MKNDKIIENDSIFHAYFMFIQLVIPSLPGYGFSSGARRPGFGFPAIATIFRRLMERLGHTKFYAMGGDLGAGITSDLATIYPKQ